MAMAAVSKGSHLRDASFSSYLDTADTDFVRSLAASMHGSSPLFTPSIRSSSPSPSPLSKRRTRGPLGELGVFGAEGYFNEKVDHDDHHHNRTPRIGSLDRHMINGVAADQVAQTKLKSKPRTPSIRSEYSSWSSKSGSFLTRQTSRDTDQIKPKKSLGRPWFFAGLQCKGSCYDVKAPVYAVKQAPTDQRKGFWEDQVVQINSKKQPSHLPRHQFKARAGEAIVLPKQPERVPLSSFAFPNYEHAQEEDPRKSIEVFGLRNIMTQKEEEYTKEMDRKLSMQSWDAIPIPVTPQHKRRSSGSCRFEDMDSEASSDLFDIAVFPAEMSPVTAPYAPSEASIDWSVVTASAAEFSTISEYDAKELHRTPMEINKLKNKPKEGQRSTANGGILGCRSDKAVKAIAPAAARMASSYPPIPPKNDCQVFSPANSSFASKAATATTTTITHFSPSPTSSARAPRAIYMY